MAAGTRATGVDSDPLLIGNFTVAYTGGMDATFTAIADPTRRALIDALRERNDSSLFDLCSRLMSVSGIAISRQAVSKHVAVLEAAGLLSVRKTGRTNIHHLDTTRLAEVTAWLNAHTNTQEEA